MSKTAKARPFVQMEQSLYLGQNYRGLCSPLLSWREDDPTILPYCAAGCGNPIKLGDPYYIVPDTNRVVCVPCAGPIAR